MEFVSGGEDEKISVRDANSGAMLRTFTGHSRPVNTVTLSLDGRLLASGSKDSTICIRNAKTGTELRKLVGHTDNVNSIIFTSDADHVISASSDKTVRRWAIGAGNGDGQVLFSQSNMVYSICLSPDENLLASGGTGVRIRFSNPLNGLEIGKPCISDAPITALGFSADGRYIASGSRFGGFVQIWNTDTREEVRKLRGHMNRISSVSFSQNGKQLLSSSCDGTIRQWDIATGAFRQLIAHTQAVWCAVYTNDEKRIISGSADGSIRVWCSDVAQKGYVPEIGQGLSLLPLRGGWIKSSTGELLLCVPPAYRNGIRDICEICIPADAPGHPVRLDWSKLVKGEKWTDVLKEGVK